MTNKSKTPQKRDETTAWPFIRWIEGRQRWQVDARTATGGKRSYHLTKGEAEATAQAARIQKTNEGSSAFDGRELAQYGWSVSQAIRFAIEHLRKQKGSVPLEDAIKSLEESKLASGKSPYYCRLLRQRLEKMLLTFKGRRIGDIMAKEIEVFLNSLAVAPATRNTIRRDMVTLWSYAVKVGLAQANEPQKVDVSNVVSSAPGIFTPDQAAALLTESRDDVLAFHAIGLFAGLRVAEIKKLDWRDVDLAGGFVHVSAANSKTRSRRLVPILDALREWITPISKMSGPIVQPNFQKRQLATRKAAKITAWPENGLRHSFVSYRLASTGDAAKTALEAGHDQAVMFAHYREVVTPKDAERFFAIRPADASEKILQMAVA